MNAPTVTVSDVQETIKKAQYHVLPGTTTTICELTLRNGFTVIGTSACASPENFNVALGEKYAFEKASEQIWQLEGYLLKERLYLATSGSAL